MRSTLKLAACAAAIAFAPAATAAVVIKAGASVVQPSENVQLDTDLVPGDNQVRGTTNQTNSTVLFLSSTDNLASPPQGQARIVASGAGASDGLGALTFSLAGGGTFTAAEFNILAGLGGSVVLSAFDAANMLLASISPTISTSGQNFFGVLADASTPISSIRITAGSGTQIASIGQFRVGGISTAINSPVPEPATWAFMVAGFGLLGLGLRRRRGSARGQRVRFSAI